MKTEALPLFWDSKMKTEALPLLPLYWDSQMKTKAMPPILGQPDENKGHDSYSGTVR